MALFANAYVIRTPSRHTVYKNSIRKPYAIESQSEGSPLISRRE